MTRILVLNNYPLDRVWREVREGDKPDHHLYGLNYFVAAGHDVQIVPFERPPRFSWVRRWRGWFDALIPLGNLERQADAWKQRHDTDLIYAPCQTETRALAYLRRLELLHVPLVCLAHHPLDPGRMSRIRRPWIRKSVLGTSRYPSLSRRVASEIDEIAGPGFSEAMPWGPDKGYYEIATGPGTGAFAAGITGRDFDTFGRAATQAGVVANIVCLERDQPKDAPSFGPKVTVVTHPDNRPLGYRALTRAFADSRVLAIPLYAQETLAGLTSLMDALGVGRPVIVTRNPLLDLDVEALGIGRWVNPGDVNGWIDALRWFDTHPVEAMEMGWKARALVDGGLHSAAFADRMMQLFDQVLSAEKERRAK